MYSPDQPGSAGHVRTQLYTFGDSSDGMLLDSGERLGPVTLAYETYGELNADKSNAILIEHALSGDVHAAGIALDDSGPSAFEPGMDALAGLTAPAKPGEIDKRKLGWWDSMIGPGKAFDTSRYFVICSNVIGGCRGSSGPASINPATGQPYGLSFPVVTIGDMVRAQTRLIDHLGIDRLLSVSGGSMGGMQALEWAVHYPDRVASCIPIATSAQLSPQSIAFNEVGRRAIMGDPDWQRGDYYGRRTPDVGLALARMIAHITYLSDEGMRQKFGRRLRDREKYGYDFSTLDFEVESYLRHQGKSFTKRFDANTYLYITKALDYFDLANGQRSLAAAFREVVARFLVVSVSSDWLYPSYQSKEIVSALKANGADVTYFEIDSSYGHDAFFLERDIMTELISGFLAHTHNSLAADDARRGAAGR